MTQINLWKIKRYDRRKFQLLIEPVIDNIYNVVNKEYFIIEENGKKGLLSEYHYVGLVLIPPKYDEIRPFHKEIFVVVENGKQKYLNAVSGEERDNPF